MTWIMFDNKILHPESGAYFKVLERIGFYSLDYVSREGSLTEQFSEALQAAKRFEELKKMLLPFNGLIGRSYKDYLNKDE